MFSPDDTDAAQSRPATPPAGTPGWFDEGDPTIPRRATKVRGWFLNMLVAELRGLLAFVDIQPDKGNDGQVLEAVQRIAGASGPRALFDTVGPFQWTVPAGVYRVRVRLLGGGGPGGHGYTGAGGGGSAGGGWDGILAVTPGETLSGVVGAAGMAGNTSGTAATAGGTTSLSRGATLLAAATGGRGGAGGGSGTGGSGNTEYGTGTDTGIVAFRPFGESGQDGIAIPALLIGGSGGGIMGLAGGKGQPVATPGSKNGNGGQIGCGGGGGVGDGLGGNGDRGLVIIEF